MLSVFYRGDLFGTNPKLSSSSHITSLKPIWDEEGEFRLFRDYFGLIRLIKNTAICEEDKHNEINNFYDFKFTQRARGDSIGSDRSFSSCSSADQEVNFDSFTAKAPGSSLAPGSPPGRPTAKRNTGDNDTTTRNRKNRNGENGSKSSKNRNANVCVFCRNNGESKKVYSSHILKDAQGNTTCPILRAYTCPLCKATGDESHTIKYCPKNKNATKQQTKA